MNAQSLSPRFHAGSPAVRHTVPGLLLAFLLASPLTLLIPHGRAEVLVTANRIVDATDTSLDGQDVVIRGPVTVTVSGPHTFASLRLENGAVVNHPPAPAGEPAHALRLTVTGDALIDAESRIDATGLGLALPTSPGAAARGDYAGGGGAHGGHGAAGGGSGSTGGRAFGSPVDPDSWGGPGGTGSEGPLAPGGGLVRLEVRGTLTVEGRILAAGASAWINNQGGGAGGTIRIDAGTLRGAGLIAAHGGAGEWVDGGGGAGGRIAITCAQDAFTGTLTASGASGAGTGGAGTIFRRVGTSPGELRIQNAQRGEWTPLTSPVPFDLVLQGNAIVYATEPLDVGSVTLGDTALLTQDPTATNLQVHARGDVHIVATANLDVDGRGYPRGDDRGPGAGTRVDWAGTGAAHGGLGGSSGAGGASGPHYGSLLEPSALGSQGGSGNSGPGTAGGGAIRLIVDGTLTVDGRLSAEGHGNPLNNSGAGSGGSVYLTVGRLAGGGVISANGGPGEWVDGGGGGGGRIAIHHGGTTFTGAITAFGGSGAQRGGAGTVYLRDRSQPAGWLGIDNGGVWGNYTPLSSPEAFSLELAHQATAYPTGPLTLQSLVVHSNTVLTHLTGQSNLTARVLSHARIDGHLNADGRGYPLLDQRGPGTGARSDWVGTGGGYGGLGGTSANGGLGGSQYGSILEPTDLGSQGGDGNSGPGTPGGGAIRLIVDGTLTLRGRISAEGGATPPNNSGGGSGGSVFLTVDTLEGTGAISVNGGPGEWVEGGGGAGGRMAIHHRNLTFAGTLTAFGGGGGQRGGAGTIYLRAQGAEAGEVRIDNGDAWGNDTPLSSPEPFDVLAGGRAILHPLAPLLLRQLELRTNSILTHRTGPAGCAVTVLRDLTVHRGAAISADGRGYPFGDDRGPGTGGRADWAGGGAGHGGAGGSAADGSVGGPTYGSLVEPVTPGSAGGTGNSGPGGAGGGVIRLSVTRTLTVDGTVSARGLDSPINNSGGGAGGSILITAGTLAGSGEINADGGQGEWVEGGSGGGGRVALHLGANLFSGPIWVRGGPPGGQAGGAGTLYTRIGNEPGGELRFTNRDRNGALTPIAVPPRTRLVVGPGTALRPVGVLELDSLKLESGASITHQVGESNLMLIVAGDLTIDAGAAVTADAKGYPIGGDPGPGAGVRGDWSGSGAGHGGLGGLSATGTAGGRHYDSILRPTGLGSQGGPGNSGPGSSGGGAIRCLVGGELRLDGRISADAGGTPANNAGGGSGGSVWIDAGTLSGSGTLTAHGGPGEWVEGGGGAGGRIALYLGTNAFTGTVAAQGRSGSQTGAAGTVYTRILREPEGRVMIENGDAWGAYTPLFSEEAFHLTVARNAQGYAEPPLIVASLDLQTNTVLSHLTGQAALELTVLGDARLAGVINTDGRGYPVDGDPGPGRGGSSGWAGGGAGHGGHGGTSASGTAGGIEYGSRIQPTTRGSQGGTGNDRPGSPGGGAVRILAGGTLTLDGSITANGLNAPNNAGGGSGGSILINTRTFAGGGTLAARGGAGDWVEGGGGGGGRIAVYRTTSSFTGSFDVQGAGGSASGAEGTVHQDAVPSLVWLSPAEDWIHGEVPLTVASFENGPLVCEFSARQGNAVVSLATLPIRLSATVPWNTATVADGPYELRAVIRDTAGTVLGESTRAVLVNNGVEWHSGPVGTSTRWTADRVHVVRGSLELSPGTTLTLGPGTVVKFLPDARLLIRAGSVLAGEGTSALPVVLTSFLDDTSGGDSNLDGAATRPVPGSWRMELDASGSIQLGDHGRVRYHSQTFGGDLAGNTTWTGDTLREITETLVVPAGATLRLEAGALLKFAPGQGIEVRPGAALVVAGTFTQPVVLTSLADDTFGGDSNRDGSRSKPGAGDWRSVRVHDGASATLDHAQLLYGGNSVGNPWGAGGALEALGGPVTVRRSVIADALKDGAFCYGQTRFENCLVLRCDRGLTAVGTMEVLNCTIDACRIGLLEHVGQLNVRNSIVSESIDAGIEHDLGGGQASVAFCNVWNPAATRGDYSGLPNLTGANGNLSAAPRYRDPSQDNYRLGFASPGIDAGDGAVAPATDLAGGPRYDDPRTGNTGTPSASGAFPDLGAYEFAETAPSNLDLAVASVSGPAALTAGSLVRLEWTILNRGAEAFTGPWHDAIYLKHAASGEKLRVSEPLVGRNITLGPGQTHTASADVRVPGGVAGEYRWVVEANSRADVFEGANAANNEGISGAGSRLAVPLLPLDGAPVAGSFTAQDEEQWFQVVAPADRDVRVALDLAAAQGVTELYLGRGFMPTPENYSARHREWGTPDTTAVASGASGDAANGGTNTFYVLAIGRALDGVPQNFQIGATGAAFSVESVSPPAVGNSGLVTLAIRGAALTTNTAFALRNASANASRVALRRSVRESGRAFATFDLAGFPAGMADLVAEADGLQVVLPQAVEVLAGGTPDFYASLSGPGTTRAGRFMTWFVTYGNRGLVDMKLPLLKFSAPGATEIRLYESTLNWTDSFTFWGLNPEALLPTLGPGQEVTFEVRIKSMVGTRITVAMMTGEQFAAETTRFNWSAIPTAPGADPARWAEMVSSLNTRLGATLGEYSALLEEDLAELAAGRLRYRYLANINGSWLLGDELRGVPRAYPIIEVPDETGDLPVAPAVHAPPKKIPGDGIRKTWFVIITMQDYSIARTNGGHQFAADTDNVAADSEDLWTYLRNDLRVPEEQSTGGHDAPGDDTVWNHDTILAAIRSFAGKVDADDNLVIVYSGHGGRGKRAGTGYLVGNGTDVSPVAFTQAIDAVGAGTTYFVNNSCHSEAFNELVTPGNTTFVGYAATKKDRIAWSDSAGSPMVAGFKGQLRKCHSLGQSFATTTESVTKEYEEMTDVRDRQSPVLTNPSGVPLDGKPWNDPAGISGPLGGAFKSPPFPGVVAGGTFTLVGSVDPNDKYALAGNGPAHWVNPTQVLPFEIVFENKTNAAAPAQEVLVIDDLDPRLDWSTFELKGLAFNDAKITAPPGLQHFSTTTQVGTDPYPVDVQVDLNPATGRITWLLRSRDPATGDLPEDPYAGFLPPNDATRRGEGSLTYTVRPLAGLPDGTSLTNRATIVFDPTYGANPPILTPWVTNTLDAAAPSSRIEPLPATAVGEVPVQWSGADAPGGSGIESYDIYASRDRGPYEPWLLATTETTARFLGEPGANYRFYSVARDAAGNREAPPSEPDAILQIEGGSHLGPITITRDGPHLRITYTGTLQAAPQVHGPWSDLPGVASPVLIAPTDQTRFFRSRR